MSLIRLERVSKRLGGKPVLRHLNLAIEKGETFVLLGASGQGKSVTLKHMVRLLTPDEGHVWVGEEDIAAARGAELERLRGRFGVLFQSAALLQWLTVEANVALPLREKTLKPEEEIRERVAEKLELLGLSDAAQQMPADLSGGMQKRVGLARAIISEPEIILYDEPTSGLDPVTARHIDEMIDEMRKHLGVTSVVVTHDLQSALQIGTRIGVIHDGHIVETATPENFVRSEVGIVRDFLNAQYITRKGKWEGN